MQFFQLRVKLSQRKKKDSSPNSPIHTLLMTFFPFATQLTTLEFSSSEEFIFSVITLVGLIGNVCEMCVLSCLRRLAGLSKDQLESFLFMECKYGVISLHCWNAWPQFRHSGVVLLCVCIAELIPEIKTLSIIRCPGANK